MAIIPFRSETGLDLGGRLTLASVATPAAAYPLRAASSLRPFRANPGQPDLYYLTSVLVTAGWQLDERGMPAGWNLNDDVFGALDCFAARGTPEDKPVNYEHDCADIIGHITANVALAGGEEVPADTPADLLPGRFDLVTQSVLYLSYDKPDREERARRIVAEIAEGLWRVSMECQFGGFDYALFTPGEPGTAKAVPRTAATAFLSRHLKAYGGTGEFRGRRIGRLLRHIVFAGKGLVRTPANPHSVILPPDDGQPGPGPMASPASGLAAPPAALPMASTVYELATAATTEKHVEKKLEEALAEAAALKVKADGLAQELAKAEAAKAAATQLAAEESAKAKALSAQVEASVAALKTESEARLKAESELKSVKDELAKAASEKKKASRAAKASAALKLDAAAAAQLAEDLDPLDEGKFDAHLAAMAALASKAAPASVLDGARPATEPALSTIPGAGESLRKSIAAYLGVAEPAN